MRTKRAGLVTMLVVLALLAAAAIGLLNVRSLILQAESERSDMEAQVAQQTQTNADLADAVANSDDPDRQAEIARDKLGLVSPGEKVFVYTD